MGFASGRRSCGSKRLVACLDTADAALRKARPKAGCGRLAANGCLAGSRTLLVDSHSCVEVRLAIASRWRSGCRLARARQSASRQALDLTQASRSGPRQPCPVALTRCAASKRPCLQPASDLLSWPPAGAVAVRVRSRSLPRSRSPPAPFAVAFGSFAPQHGRVRDVGLRRSTASGDRCRTPDAR